MSTQIRPLREEWTLYIKGLTEERHSITIEKVCLAINIKLLASYSCNTIAIAMWHALGII